MIRFPYNLLIQAICVTVCVVAVLPSMVMAELATVPVTSASQFGAPDQSSMAGSCIRMVGGLFLCLGVFAAGIHLYRRYMAQHGVSSKRRLVIRERIAISPKSSLLVIALDGKEFLVSNGSERVTLLPAQALLTTTFTESLTEACNEVEVFNA